MPVEAIDRKPLDTLMDVQRKAYGLFRYTAHAASSEKVVPKRLRWVHGDALVESSRSICRCIDMANTIRIDIQDADWETRGRHQEAALGHTWNLLTEIHMAYFDHSFDTKKLSFWIELVETVQRLLRAWQKSDAERRRKSGCG